MAEPLHHVHLFAADIDAAIARWRDMPGGKAIHDGDFGGAAENVSDLPTD